MERRKFIRSVAGVSAGVTGLMPINGIAKTSIESSGIKLSGDYSWHKLSLAQWSLHRAFIGSQDSTLFYTDTDAALAGWLDPMQFPAVAKREFGIDAVEYVNLFFYDKARNKTYLNELKTRCNDEGVQSLLIMCDEPGIIGDPDKTERLNVVEKYYKWVESASFLGCHSIRVIAKSEGSWNEQMKLVADALNTLSDYGKKFNIDIVVENRNGTPSSNGKWLLGLMKMVDHPNCGTLPDFGCFKYKEGETYDRYKGIKELLPYARGLGAKTMSFDDEGNENMIDYYRMMKIVKESGFTGHIGIEWEGMNEPITEFEGIKATKKLIEKAGDAA